MISFRPYFWLIPFASFISGYFAMTFFFKTKEVQVPVLIGKPIAQALEVASKHDLNIRITGHKEDQDLADGTVISQNPAPGTKVKIHQTLYLVISKKPNLAQIPSFIGHTLEDIQKMAQDQGLSIQAYPISSSCMPSGQCMAQDPAPGTKAVHKNVIVYICDSGQKPLIMPDFKGQTLENVQQVLQLHGMESHVIQSRMHPENNSAHAIIIDQRPLAGSLVKSTAQKPLLVQLQV